MDGFGDRFNAVFTPRVLNRVGFAPTSPLMRAFLTDVSGTHSGTPITNGSWSAHKVLPLALLCIR